MTCDAHPKRPAVRIKVDAAGTRHRCCAECVEEIARVLRACVNGDDADKGTT